MEKGDGGAGTASEEGGSDGSPASAALKKAPASRPTQVKILGLAIQGLCWAAALAAVAWLAASYASLPDSLPLSRWSSAPKSILIAFRVPIIDLAMMGLAILLGALLEGAIGRPLPFGSTIGKSTAKRGDGKLVGLLLLVTASAKTCLESLGIAMPTGGPLWLAVLLGVTVIGGLGAALIAGRAFLIGATWRAIAPSRAQTILLLALLALIVAMELPLLLVGKG